VAVPSKRQCRMWPSFPISLPPRFQAFSACLESREYMQIRNGLIMLTKIIDYFPVVAKLATSMEEVVTKLKEDDREDLKILATRYHAMLSNKKSAWIAEESFHSVKAGGRPPAPSFPPSAAVPPVKPAKSIAAATQVSSLTTAKPIVEVRNTRSSDTNVAPRSTTGVPETMATTTATAMPSMAETKKRPVQAQTAYAGNSGLVRTVSLDVNHRPYGGDVCFFFFLGLRSAHTLVLFPSQQANSSRAFFRRRHARDCFLAADDRFPGSRRSGWAGASCGVASKSAVRQTTAGSILFLRLSQTA
jgi:hypothetical protein